MCIKENYHSLLRLLREDLKKAAERMKKRRERLEVTVIYK